MVNRERVKLLVDALRSGEYEQCQGALVRTAKDGSKSYCCLGVATVVALKNGVPSYFKVEDYERRGFTVMPYQVSAWCGFPEDNPWLVTAPSGQRASAVHLNDCERYPFDQIADAFERTFLSEEAADAR